MGVLVGIGKVVGRVEMPNWVTVRLEFGESNDFLLHVGIDHRKGCGFASDGGILLEEVPAVPGQWFIDNDEYSGRWRREFVQILLLRSAGITHYYLKIITGNYRQNAIHPPNGRNYSKRICLGERRC